MKTSSLGRAARRAASIFDRRTTLKVQASGELLSASFAAISIDARSKGNKKPA